MIFTKPAGWAVTIHLVAKTHLKKNPVHLGKRGLSCGFRGCCGWRRGLYWKFTLQLRTERPIIKTMNNKRMDTKMSDRTSGKTARLGPVPGFMVPGLMVLIIIVIAALVGMSCSDNPGVRLRYQAEKMLFAAERASRDASIRPELMTPTVVDSLQREYSSVLDYCYQALDSIPGTTYQREREEISEIAFRAASRVAQVFYRDRHYDTCVVLMNRLLADTDVKGASMISAYLNLGQALQSSGNWDSALTIYEYSVENFYPPVDGRGNIIYNLFNLPAHIFSVYTRIGDTIAARIQLDNAEYYYRDIVNEHPGTELERAARSSLTSLYESTGQWQQAIDQLDRITDSLGQQLPAAKQRIADIYASRLKRPDTALVMYDQLMSELKGKDTIGRPLVLFKKALALTDKKEYDEARKILVQIKNDYGRFYRTNAMVQSAIARTFEMENNWERAEDEYKFLLDDQFAQSEESMNTYLYLIGWYENHDRKLEAERLAERAAAKFDQLAAGARGTQLEANALTHKAELLKRQKDWPRTVAILEEIFDKFPGTDVGYQSLVSASVIYREKMKDPATADSLINVLKSRLTAVDERPEM